MKYLSILWLIIVLGFQPVSAHVGLDYPRGGESFNVGETVTIQWHVIIAHDQQNWDLFFSSDGGANWTSILSDIPVEQTSYDWTVPDMQTDQGRIKIVMDNNGFDYEDSSADFVIQEVSTNLITEGAVTPHFQLKPNYPNPFNSSTVIRYSLTQKSLVDLQIFSLKGKSVNSLIRETQQVGNYQVRWNGLDNNGNPVASGVYLLRLQAEGQQRKQRIILVR